MLGKRLEQFLFPVRSDRWIAILRFGLGLQVIVYALSLRRDWNYLFAADNQGIISRELTEAILSVKSAFIPRLGWLVTLGGKLGLDEDAMLALGWAALLGTGLFLLAGFLCRPSAIAAWLLHLAARGSGGFVTYGVDSFMTIGLFYLALAPLPDRYSLDALLFKWRLKADYRIGFHQRVLQLHLCFIYFFGGLAKLLGAGWWDGTSMWRALTRPPFNIIPAHALLSAKYLLPFLGIFICLLEFGYPLFIWLRSTSRAWLLLVLLMHIGIAVAMHLQLFALIMVILNLAAFGSIFSGYSLARQRT
jgi:hypothetical protein